jgi:hypothetical protein
LTQRKPEPTPIEAFLAPLARIARKAPEIEGLVFWDGSDGWDDSPSEALEAEEIAFYAEGLLLDDFRMRWWLVAVAESPGLADHLRLAFWQDDSPPPVLPEGWVALEGGTWAGNSG